MEILPGAAGPLAVIQRGLSNGRARLLWTGAPGRTYAIEYTDQLGGSWTRLPGEQAAEGAVELDTAAAAHRFFRVVELP